MVLKPKNPPRKELLANRKRCMLEAWNLDNQSNASPLALYWKKDFGRTWEYKFIAPPHHFLNRDKSGKYDSVEYLMTLNRLEHNFCELGCKPLQLTGVEYEYLILWLSMGRPNNRWDEPRHLKAKKLEATALKRIMKLAETF